MTPIPSSNIIALAIIRAEVPPRLAQRTVVPMEMRAAASYISNPQPVGSLVRLDAWTGAYSWKNPIFTPAS